MKKVPSIMEPVSGVDSEGKLFPIHKPVDKDQASAS